MKKFIIFLGIGIVLIAGAFLIVPKLIPIEKIKPAIQEKVKEATGRDLKIAGPIDIKLFPSLALQLNDVSLSNAAWGKAENLVSLATLDVELKVMPLLSKSVEIDRFVLREPRITLEKSKTGQGNWAFSSAQSEETAKEDTADAPAKATSTGDYNITFGDVKIIDGVLRYEDLSTAESHVLDAIQITIDATKLDAPMRVKGAAEYRARKLALDFSADSLQSLIESKPFTGTLGLNVEPFADIQVDGKFMESKNAYAAAKVDVKISDLNGLLNWVSPTRQGDVPFQVLNFSTETMSLETTAQNGFLAKLNSVDLRADEWNVTGDVSFKQTPHAPSDITASFAVPKVFDVYDFMQKMAGDAPAGDSETAPENKATSEKATGWSEEVIDFSAIRAVNGKISLAHQGLIYKNLKSGAGQATITLSNGKLVFEMPTTAVDKGTLYVKADVQDAGKASTIALNMKAADMPIQPFLVAFADVNKLSGTGSVSFNANATGNTQKAIVSSLMGKAGLNLRDGTLHGVNFVDITKMVQKRLTQVGLGDGGTEFTDFDANFDIKNGVMTNTDMALIGPLVEARGAGTIDLPTQAMAYRVTPRLILKKGTETNAETGESKTVTTGIAVPVDIKGPWARLKIKPDYKAVLKDALKNPEELEDAAKSIASDLEDKVKNLEDNKDLIKEDLKQLKGLFGQ